MQKMSQNLNHPAARPNPALEPLSVLVGEWDTVATHRLFPDKTVRGHTSFTWIEGGAYLMMRSSVEEEGFPSGITIYGSDDAAQAFFCLYFDERGVSRVYQAALRDNTWTQWRNVPGFSQRFTGTIAANGDTILGVWELNEDDATWKRDLEIKYTRVR